MNWKKKTASLLLTGTLAVTVLAPTALAGYVGEVRGLGSGAPGFFCDGDRSFAVGEYSGYREFYDEVSDGAASGYALVDQLEYDIPYGGGDASSSQHYTFNVDNEGKLLKCTLSYSDDDETNMETTYTYGDNGYLKNVERSYDNWHDTCEVTCDSSGNVIHEIFKEYPISDLSKCLITYEYDYKYDANGRLIEWDGQAVQNEYKYLSKCLYKYDGNGNIISIDGTNTSISDETTTNKRGNSYQYNNQGQLTQISQYQDDSENQPPTTFEYDAQGRLIKILAAGYDGIEKYEYEYDSQNRVTRIRNDYITYGYEYDSAGNLIRKNEYHNGELDSYKVYKYKKLGSTSEPHVGQFTDVLTSSYYAGAVKWAVEQGITNGTSDTAFSPDNSCTRAQIMTMLWRASNSPEPATTNNPFTDVKENDYYYKAVLWAVEKGITKGTSNTTFSPNATCSRGQAMTFLWNAKEKPTASNTISFTDVNSGDYFYNPVKWAVQNNITSGTSATAFSPNQNCTRAQIVTFLYKAMA